MTNLRTAIRAIARSRAPFGATVTVDGFDQISENFIRVSVSGEDLASYTEPHPGDAFKLMFPHAGQQLPAVQHDNHGLPFFEDPASVTVRALTIRTVNPSSPALTFDIVTHPGALADWLATVQRGDRVVIRGMRPEYSPVTGIDHQVFIADPTAIPAAAAIAETLPAGTASTAVLAVDSTSDRGVFPDGTGMDIVWAEPGFQPGVDHPLTRAVTGLDKPAGRVQVWARAESSVLRAIRDIILESWQVDSEDFSVSAYWKAGLDQQASAAERQHRLQKLAAQGADMTNPETMIRAELDLDATAEKPSESAAKPTAATTTQEP